jgi:hypothetical protein
MSTYEGEDWAVQAVQIAGRGRIPTARAEKKTRWRNVGTLLLCR